MALQIEVYQHTPLPIQREPSDDEGVQRLNRHRIQKFSTKKQKFNQCLIIGDI
jgi:hypothetical protein